MGTTSAEAILDAIQTHAKRWAPLIRGPGLERQLADDISLYCKELELPKKAFKRLGDNVSSWVSPEAYIAVVAHLDARLDQASK